MSCYHEGAFECRNLWASTRQCARRLDVCGDGGSVRKFNGAASVVNLDSSKVAQEKLLSVFGAERTLESPGKANQLTQFTKMIASVRYRDQPARVTERSMQLTYCQIDVRNVVQHPRGDRSIEGSVLERKCLDVGLLRGDAFVRCESNHRRRKVNRDDRRGEGLAHRQGEISEAAADLEDSLRLDLA
jgi:hypothetical protein